jgi:hypothetical protein
VQDFHPELADYEPFEQRPLRSKRTTYLIRIVVIVAIGALVLPGVLTTYSFAESSANASCAIWVDHQEPTQHRAFARFEAFGPGFLGWECYAVTAEGTAHVLSLGMLPGLSEEQAAVIGR